MVEDLERDNMPKKEIRKRTESKGYSWFSWRRNNQAEEGEEPKIKKSDEYSQEVLIFFIFCLFSIVNFGLNFVGRLFSFVYFPKNH